MRWPRLALFGIAFLLGISPLVARAVQSNPYVGSWALTVPGGGPGWLGVTERDGKLQAAVMWIGGSVVPVDEVRVEGDHLVIVRRQQWQERDASSGQQVRRKSEQTITARRNGDALDLTTKTVREDRPGDARSEPFTGKLLPAMPAAPVLSRVRFGQPIQLFNGRNLTGWRLTDPNASNGWKVENGELVNDPVQTPGAPHKNYGNLRTDREFEDFRLTLDVNVPKDGNSGVYLRGVYEVQVADTYGRPTDAHNMGGVYSRIKPTASAEKPAGEWQTLDMTLVDRHVTVILNGTKIIDNQPVPGPTGGALWSDVTRPGPIYLQGDHAGVKYRNIVLRPVVR
jgi:hypothetical protein